MLGKPARIAKKLARRTRGAYWFALINLSGGKASWPLEIDKGAVLRWGPHPGLHVGPNVYIGIGVVLDVPDGAALTIGGHCKIMHYSVVAASESISIGEKTQIAEHCSVRDADHGMSTSIPMAEQPMQSQPVRIGSDVWVGRGVAVLKGTVLGNGCVIGANSLCRQELPDFSVAVGVPARVKRDRSSVMDDRNVRR